MNPSSQNILFLLLFFIFSITESFSQVINTEYFFNQQLNHSKSNDINFTNYISSLNNLTKRTFTNNSLEIDSIIVYSTEGPKRKFNYAYGENGKIASFIISNLQNDFWVNNWKIIYAYDSVLNKISTFSEVWNGNGWDSYMFVNYYYDNSGNDTLEIAKLWTNNHWENTLRIVKKYNLNESLIKLLTQEWSDSIWVNSSLIFTQYYENGLEKLGLLKNWNGSNWINYRQLSFNYNNDWDLISILVKNWHGNSWENYFLTTINYNLVAPQTVGLLQEWVNNQWEINSRYSYSYNSENYFIQGIYQYWLNDNWFPGDGVIHIVNPDGFEEHILASKVDVYYNKVTNVADNSGVGVSGYSLEQNFPNPFNPATTIEYSIPAASNVTLVVYNLLGEKVAVLVDEYQQTGRYKAKFNAKNLPSGVYIYKLTAGKFSSAKKLMLMK